MAPCGIVKSNTAASAVPELLTIAAVPASPVVVVPTVNVAAIPVGPVGPVGPVAPVAPVGPVGPPVGPVGPVGAMTTQQLGLNFCASSILLKAFSYISIFLSPFNIRYDAKYK